MGRHDIRLRGPWQYQPLSRYGVTGVLPPPGRVTMPADWGQSLGADFRGCVRYRRPFHGPTGLTPDLYLKVWLVLEGADARATVTLNGQPLGIVPGPDCQTEFDVTTMLQEQNELIVVVECPACDGDRPLPRTPDRQQRPGGLIGEVRLEIRGQDA